MELDVACFPSGFFGDIDASDDNNSAEATANEYKEEDDATAGGRGGTSARDGRRFRPYGAALVHLCDHDPVVSSSAPHDRSKAVAIVRIFPCRRSREQLSSLGTKRGEEALATTMRIHPLLRRVLVRSATEIWKEDGGGGSRRHHHRTGGGKTGDTVDVSGKQQQRPAPTNWSVGSKEGRVRMLLADFDAPNTESDDGDGNDDGGSSHTARGGDASETDRTTTVWVERVKVRDHVAREDNDKGDASRRPVWNVRLSYMCGIGERGRYFGRGARVSYGNDDNDDERALRLLAKRMADRLVVEGGILGVDVSKKGPAATDEEEDIYDKRDREIAFFMVERIDRVGNPAPKKASDPLMDSDEDKRDDADVTRTCYQLGNYGSFALSLFPPPDDDEDPCRISNRGSHPQIRSLSTYRCGSDGRVEKEDVSCPGYNATLRELLSLAAMEHPDCAPSAVMLSGCAGVGKTRMASWLVKELSESSSPRFRVRTIVCSARDILLEAAASPYFDERSFASKLLDDGTSSSGGYADNGRRTKRLVIIDDLDVVINAVDGSESSSLEGMDSEQLCAFNAIVHFLDEAVLQLKTTRPFIVGISRASWSQLPTQLARVGRFEKVVTMPPPTQSQRKDIISFWLRSLPSSSRGGGEMTGRLAERTAGCVASDIRRICVDALTRATARSRGPGSSTDFEASNFTPALFGNAGVQWEDIKEAARTCVPSQLASLDVTPVDLGDLDDNDNIIVDARKQFDHAWRSFGGYHAMKKRLYRTIVRPWKHHMDLFASTTMRSADSALDISRPSGVLFHGEPGTGKTFAAMCLASSLGLHCVKVRASEVFNQWLGGSEATIRSIFARARAASPCILFFDELDSLAMNREDDADSAGGVQSRILSTLLNEMDGVANTGGKQGILVVAATNRLRTIDAALLRPGRLEEHILLSLPEAPDVREMLELHSAKMPLDETVDLKKLSEMLASSQISGANVEGICRDACLIAMRRCSAKENRLAEMRVSYSDIHEALHRIRNTSVMN